MTDRLDDSGPPSGPFDDGIGAGRGKDGKFLPGNKLSRGNPFARRVIAWRRAFIRAVPLPDLVEVVQMLIESAKKGESWAVREVLNRCLGRAEPPVEADMGRLSSARPEESPAVPFVLDARLVAIWRQGNPPDLCPGLPAPNVFTHPAVPPGPPEGMPP